MPMHLRALVLLLLCAVCVTKSLQAQLPFYTDDPSVTEKGNWHFEFFNEFDALQSSQYPNLRQNWANFKLNCGLPHNLELDADVPYLAIYRAPEAQTASGVGDADMGIKWKFRKSPRPFSPALAASLYIE